MINYTGDFYLGVVCEPFHLYIVWESWVLHALIITPHIVSSHIVFIKPTLWSTSHIRTWSWNRQGSGLTSWVKRCWSWYKSRLFSSPVLAANPRILPLQSWLIMTDKTSVACLKMHHAAMLLLVCHCENHALTFAFCLLFLTYGTHKGNVWCYIIHPSYSMDM